MRYLFLVYSDEQHWNSLPTNERSAFAEACFASDQALQESGYLLDAANVQSSAATIVRVQHGKLSLTDGPFTRADEQLVGIFFINARDLNEAIQIAARMPQARRGPIEVRSIMA